MTKHQLRIRKTIAAGSIFLASVGIAYASCGGTEGMVETQSIKNTASITAALGLMFSEMGLANQAQTQLLVSLNKVVSKQINISSEKTGQMMVKAQETYAAATQERTIAEVSDEIVMNSISQGANNPCQRASAAVAMRKVEVEMPAATTENFERISSTKFSSDVAAEMSARREAHFAKFCTADEVNAGVCSKLGAKPGADINAETLFSSATDPDSKLAKQLYKQNILGLPESTPPKEVANQPAGNAAVYESKRNQAFMAMPAASLSAIEAENEKLLPELRKRAEPYFGTSEKAGKWAKNVTAQAAPGIMRDMLIIQGMNLKYAQMRLQSGMRTEANLAAMLELENQRVNGTATRVAETIATATAARARVKQ